MAPPTRKGRPDGTGMAAEIGHMQEKVAAGADFSLLNWSSSTNISMISWNNWRRKRITAPVFIGVMPVYNTRQIWRITELAGAEILRELNLLLEKYVDSPADAEKVGIDFAVRQIADL